MQIPRRSHGCLPRVAGAELGLADEVVEVAPGADLLRPCRGENVHVRSGIQFPYSVGYSRLFDVYDPYGTHSTWYCPFLLGLSSYEMAILGIFHAALRVGPVILRKSGGLITEVDTAPAA